MENIDLTPFFNGEKLYGDDFSIEQIQDWFNSEKDAYAKLGIKDRKTYRYSYHRLNEINGFRFLPDKNFTNVLGFGSFFGDEFLPIINKIRVINIVDPCEGLTAKDIMGVPLTLHKPRVDGRLEFDDDCFDLITCFGVLHHIPNVSDVVKELYRCLKPKGYLLMREPITSMGDWRTCRVGVTPRERGIPLGIFRAIVASTRFRVIQERMCMFALTSKLQYFLKTPVYNSKFIVSLDYILCALFSKNCRYYATSMLGKLRPTSIFYVLSKD
jgi:SAM-dependent methyltransferase